MGNPAFHCWRLSTQPALEDVPGRVHVAVVDFSTGRASPRSYSETCESVKAEVDPDRDSRRLGQVGHLDMEADPPAPRPASTWANAGATFVATLVIC
jgi:hypothetical protein